MNAKTLVETLLTRPMNQAQYFCTGDRQPDEWRHYALNFDVYTHFTSPIRRYADVIVHRLLQLTIDMEEIERNVIGLEQQEEALAPLLRSLGTDTVAAIAEKCNTRKMNAGMAQEHCDRVFLCIYLKDHPLVESAVVTDMGPKSMQILVSRLGLEQRVPFDSIKDKTEYVHTDQQKNQITIAWNSGTKQVLNIFDAFRVRLTCQSGFPMAVGYEILEPSAEPAEDEVREVVAVSEIQGSEEV